MTAIHADRLITALAAAGIHATWEHTGGNVGCLNAGPYIHDGHGDIAYAIVIGPGDYANGMLHPEELCVGTWYTFDQPATNDGVGWVVDDIVRVARELDEAAEDRWIEHRFTITYPQERITS